MKKRTSDKFWFPWWPDKWIFGSVRIECTPAERGIWVDLLSLASKDDGHIRANEETPYPLQQLSGMLIIPEEELNKAINKFIKKGKLTKEKTGTLYVTKWRKYQFSNRHKRRVMSASEDSTSEKGTPIINNSKKHNNKLNKKTYTQSELNSLFEKWFKRYPRTEDKGKAREKWMHLVKVKGVDPQQLEDALTGYINCLNSQQTPIEYIKHAKTFLYAGKPKENIPGTWEEYVKYANPKYKSRPKL